MSCKTISNCRGCIAGLAASLAVALLQPYSQLRDAAADCFTASELPPNFQLTGDLLALVVSRGLLPALQTAPAAWAACTRALAAYQGVLIDPEALVELRHCIAPHAVAQLVSAGRLTAAALLVSQQLRMHPVLATLTGALAMLEPYLTGHGRAARAADTALLSVTGCSLPHTAERLFKSIGTECDAALSHLQYKPGVDAAP